jgi:fused signal recognition particle receptor
VTLTIVIIAVAVVLLASAAGYLLYIAPRRRGQPPEVTGPPRSPEEPDGAVVTEAERGSPPSRAGPVDQAPPAEEAERQPELEDGGLISAEPEAETVETVETVEAVETVEVAPRFRDRLGRARLLLGGYLSSVRSKDRIDESTWEDLEECLILADVGAGVTAELLDELRARARKDSLESPDALVEALKDELKVRLYGDNELHMSGEGTTVWLFVGVNGVGKTTTIGKLGMRQARAGHTVVMAAGDTFRAAAADQLEMWSDRVGASVVRGGEGADPGAVVFDAVQHAAARDADLVLADTAGRLHTKTNLMEELKKVRRVAERPPGVVTEVLLVIDATTGQNGLIQARQFASAVGVTGVVLTKLDGTAKGGIVVAIRSELGIPIKQVGLGEGPEDLVDFDADEFVDALMGSPEDD